MKIVALAGGVGGAKLADGLALCLPAGDLTIIVNTGDDFDHLGLRICPDVDTVCYTLGGLANPVTGWGRQDETWNALEALRRLGGEDWFALGDRDLGTHLMRTRLLKDGMPLSDVVKYFCRQWEIGPTVLPMTDQPVMTMVDTVEFGELPFQEYFVRLRCTPTAKGFRFFGIEAASPAPGVLDAILKADAVVFCPSNPWVSLDPILALEGVRAAISGKLTAVVSPIVRGQALKGPAAKMFTELGFEPSALAVLDHYRDLTQLFIFDELDAALKKDIGQWSIILLATNTVMKNREDRKRLAAEILDQIDRMMEARTS